ADNYMKLPLNVRRNYDEAKKGIPRARRLACGLDTAMNETLKGKRVLSGVQSSGKLHLGNYFGAIKQHIALQDEAACFYFIADYHSLTTIHDAPLLRQFITDAALDYLALGLDPKKAVFFRQS